MSKPTRKSANGTRQRDRIPDPLAALRDDFERQIESMQTPANKEAADALFAATGAEIGALAAARARESARIDAASQTELAAKPRVRKPSIAQSSRKLSAQSLAANKSMEASLNDGLDSPEAKRVVQKRQIDRMLNDNVRTGAAIDDANDNGEAPIRKIVRVETKKKMWLLE